MNLAQRNVVLATLAGVLAVPTFLQWRRDAESFVDVGAVPLLFDGFTADNVGLITIGQPKKEQPVPEANNPNAPKVAYDQLVLQRSDKGWMLAQVQGQELPGAPVNKDQVEANVFAHLRAIRIDRDVLVQPNATPEQLEKFGLDEAHAFVIVATDASPQRNVIADLMVGKDAGQGQTGTEAVRGVYVRKRDSTDVVLYEFDKGWLRSAQQDQWLDKVLAKLEPDKIQRLSIKNTATPEAVVFERKDGKASWTAVAAPAGVGAVRQTEVENVVQRLRWIAVQDYRMRLEHARLAELGVAPGKIQIDLTVRDGDKVREIKLSVGNQLDGKNEFYLLCTEQPQFLMTWPGGTVTPFELDVKAQCFDPGPQAPEKPGEGDKKDEPKKDDAKKEEGKK